MKIPKNEHLISVIIVNYNNAKYLKRSLDSVINQEYKNKEIIIVDDMSTDNSIKILKKYERKVKIIQNKKKTNIAAYDQMNSYYNGFLQSKGDYVCFLDSDDFFKKNKLKKIINLFQDNISLKLIFDKPLIYFDKKNFYPLKINERNTRLTPWPRFTSQSCISIERSYLKKIFNIFRLQKFPNIWFDFRIALQGFIDFKKLFITNNYLTYYQQSTMQASSRFKRWSLNWWKRRKEAHDFTKFLFKKNNVKKKITFDEYLTNAINLFIKK